MSSDPDTWQQKARDIVAEDCLAAYKRANPRPTKRPKPYVVPPQAAALVDCLNTLDEERAKSIFLHRATFGPTEFDGTYSWR